MSTVFGGVDYGPLYHFIGTWFGESGTDRAPKPVGDKVTDFFETIVFTPVGEVDNAEEQDLVVLHYHEVVTRKGDGKVYHNQTGYWMWEKGTDRVMYSVAIPRGVCLIAEGSCKGGDEVTFAVRAEVEDEDYSIVQSKFMNQKAKTEAFEIKLELSEGKLSYEQTTFLDIYGKKFEHTDRNVLSKK